MSDTDKLRCVERELTFRRLVYPPRVKAGTMTQRDAEYEIRMMECIADDYRKKIGIAETGDLFGGQGKAKPAPAEPAAES